MKWYYSVVYLKAHSLETTVKLILNIFCLTSSFMTFFLNMILKNVLNGRCNIGFYLIKLAVNKPDGRWRYNTVDLIWKACFLSRGNSSTGATQPPRSVVVSTLCPCQKTHKQDYVIMWEQELLILLQRWMLEKPRWYNK